MRVAATFRGMTYDAGAIASQAKSIKAKGLQRAGEKIRHRARSSLRRRKQSSTAPAPPSVHTDDGAKSLRNIQVAAEGIAAVIVGVARVTWVPLENGRTIPQIIHDGGIITRWQIKVRDKQTRKSRWVLWRLRSAPGRQYESRRIAQKYRPRPFMAQALRAAIASQEIIQAFSENAR